MIPYRIKIDMDGQKDITTNITLSAGDVNSYGLVLEFYRNGKPYDITGYNLSVMALPAGATIPIPDIGTVQDGRGYYTIKQSMYAYAGETRIEIVLSDDSGSTVVKVLHFSVRSGFSMHGGSIVDEKDFGVLQMLIRQAQAAIVNAERFETRIEEILGSSSSAFAELMAQENNRLVFGGRNLGGTVTNEQIDAIRSGTFEGLLLGDYWHIDGYHFRIADFDYYYGVQGMNKHHVVIVPDEVWGKNLGVVGDMSIVTSGKGGYARTKMFQKVLPEVYEKFQTDAKLQPIGKYILEYQDLLTNAVADNVPVGTAWYPCNVNIMDEMMLFGTKINAPMQDGSSAISTQTASRFQFALFAVAPKFMGGSHNYWLRDVASFTYFSFMAANGAPMTREHNYPSGRIRPYFLIG